MARARTTSPRRSPWPSPAAGPSRPRALHPDSLNRRIWRPSAAALSPSCRSIFPGSCPERWTPPGSPPPAWSIPVEVLDSRTVGMAQGMGVQGAVAAAADGAAAADVRGSAEHELARTKVYFYVPSLEQLRRGGRIGAAASLWGTMFSIKPILAVEDGKVVPLEKVRSAAKAIARLKEIVVADAAGPARGAGPAGRPPFRQPGRGGTARVAAGRRGSRLRSRPDQRPAGRAGGPCRPRCAGSDRGGGQHPRSRGRPRRAVVRTVAACPNRAGRAVPGGVPRYPHRTRRP